MKFIDSVRFMTSSPSRVGDNFTKGLYKDKVCKFNLEYMTAKNNITLSKCADCNKNFEKEFDEDPSKRFGNIYRFCDGDINKFCLML